MSHFQFFFVQSACQNFHINQNTRKCVVLFEDVIWIAKRIAISFKLLQDHAILLPQNSEARLAVFCTIWDPVFRRCLLLVQDRYLLAICTQQIKSSAVNCKRLIISTERWVLADGVPRFDHKCATSNWCRSMVGVSVSYSGVASRPDRLSKCSQVIVCLE